MGGGKLSGSPVTIITTPRGDAAASDSGRSGCMTCCAGHCAAAGFFDARIAKRDLRRYQRRGPDSSTRMLLSGLRRGMLDGLHLLDVGSGIGVIAAELAVDGLASATLVDSSPAYLEVARRNVGSRYVFRPAQFILGDFATTAASLPEADIVTLDRVVCCYPNAEALLSAAAARSRSEERRVGKECRSRCGACVWHTEGV